MITVVEKGKVVHAQPDVLGPKDILEVAQALIETFGWNNTTKGKYVASSEKQGFTLHDAIGEANIRLSAHESYGSTKDYMGMRSPAEALVEQHTPIRQAQRLDTKATNDKATSVDQIIKILEKARAA